MKQYFLICLSLANFILNKKIVALHSSLLRLRSDLVLTLMRVAPDNHHRSPLTPICEISSGLLGLLFEYRYWFICSLRDIRKTLLVSESIVVRRDRLLNWFNSRHIVCWELVWLEVIVCKLTCPISWLTLVLQFVVTIIRILKLTGFHWRLLLSHKLLGYLSLSLDQILVSIDGTGLQGFKACCGTFFLLKRTGEGAIQTGEALFLLKVSNSMNYVWYSQ